MDVDAYNKAIEITSRCSLLGITLKTKNSSFVLTLDNEELFITDSVKSVDVFLYGFSCGKNAERDKRYK